MAPLASSRRTVASAKPNGAGTTIATRPGRASAAASIAPASAPSIAMRPSTRTCFPASSAAIAIGAWRYGQVATTTASTAGSATSSAQSAYVRSIPSSAAARALDSGVRFDEADELDAGDGPKARDVARPGDATRPHEPDPDPLGHRLPPSSPIGQSARTPSSRPARAMA